jgi:hypothetical protein
MIWLVKPATVEIHGIRIRLWDVDAPEISLVEAGGKSQRIIGEGVMTQL